ncbi:MAG: hypothetical protein CMH64_04380 [Nanoarchaeota archaeon]|nr:hypothetical protein [Nanoarchaeota archaeon]|tara:strand:- start:2506 stop:2931 length:426 start_codon:yes stop_codon:yes gene_type:complete
MSSEEKPEVLRSILEGIEPTSVFEGEVQELDYNGGGLVLAVSNDGEDNSVFFSESYLAKVKAAFPSAKIRHRTYSLSSDGESYFEVRYLEFLGPTKEELMAGFKRFSPEDIKALDEMYPRNVAPGEVTMSRAYWESDRDLG